MSGVGGRKSGVRSQVSGVRCQVLEVRSQVLSFGYTTDHSHPTPRTQLPTPRTSNKFCFLRSPLYLSGMIELRDVSKAFNRGNANEIKALNHVSLSVSQGEYLVLVGSNGSGKSTLLNAIAGAFGIDQGSIFLDNQNVTQLKDFARSAWIARIFQNPLSGTAPDLSILDNFRLAALRTRSKSLRIGITNQFKKEVQNKIALLGMGLENKLHQKMGDLSGGQRQALTLIMAIMDEAKILLMDEPSAALDPKSAENLMEKAALIRKEFNLTLILVTHDLKDAHRYGHRIIQMQEGRIHRDLSGAEKSELNLTDLFQWFA
ncbi:MAG: ATP-binding cassette domain-containing protein [Microscillaceae bacterium]|nr:ATP-binding cassette domain-containing protein [Microscillaceae bacterium]